MDTCVKYMLIKKYQQLMDERLQTHRIFDEAHKIYLSSGPEYDFAHFRKLVADVTQDFKRISNEVTDIENKLREGEDLTAIADFMKDTEMKEKRKLELSAQLQLAKQKRQEHVEQENGENIDDLIQELDVVTNDIDANRKKIITISKTILL